MGPFSVPSLSSNSAFNSSWPCPSSQGSGGAPWEEFEKQRPVPTSVSGCSPEAPRRQRQGGLFPPWAEGRQGSSKTRGLLSHPSLGSASCSLTPFLGLFVPQFPRL